MPRLAVIELTDYRRAVCQAGLRVMRRAFLSTLAVLMLAAAIGPAYAERGDRTLYLYYTHTRETTKITFKRNGKYVKKGLKDLNWFLRDWRRKEATKMDPRLFDLLWEVYRDVNAKKPIHIVSAYRSPKTNEMLRSRSSAVAKNSRHTQGMAMDFFIPGVKLSYLRATAMKKQFGGVGYYPRSGSPFVHLDTGNVRAWPRMTHTQLAKVFPRGKTLHLPSNGKALSAKGRRYAAAQWKKCKRVPCSAGAAPSFGSGNTLLALFGNDKGKKVSSPVTRSVAIASISSPIPVFRPAALASLTGAGSGELIASEGIEAAVEAEILPPVPLAPKPPFKPKNIMLATRATVRKTDPIENNFALDLNLDDIPFALASLNIEMPPLPPSQKIASETLQNASSVIASLASDKQPSTDLLAFARSNVRGAFSFDAIDEILAAATPGSRARRTAQPTLTPGLPRARPAYTNPNKVMFAAIDTREGELFAPDLDHVADTMIGGYAFASAKFADLWQPDLLEIDAATDLGAGVLSVKFSNTPDTLFQSNQFQRRTFSVASR